MLVADYSDRNLSATVEVLRKWVTQKKGFGSLPSKGEVVTNVSGARLVGSEFFESDRGVSGFRWTLTEDWASPKWYQNPATSRVGVTQISLVFSRGQLWLWTDVEPPTLEYTDSSGRDRVEPQASGTPAFVSDILGEVELRDGIEYPTSEIETIASDSHVDHLVRILRDGSRRGAVYVTSPPAGISEGEWRQKISQILGRIEGIGFAYILRGDARLAFNNQVAHGHTISAGSLRTFLPGADLLDPKDALRHRLLHPSTILGSRDARLKRIIRNAQIERLRDMELPEALREADYAFLRQRGMRAFDVLHASHRDNAPDASAVDSEELRSKLREAEEFLELALQDNEKLDDARVAARAHAEELRTENREMFEDLSALRVAVERSQREVLHLRRELTRLGADGSSAAYGFVDDDPTADYPSTFHELLQRIDGLDGIRYFGDRDDAEELDELAGLGDAPLMKAWDALVTFHCYARSRAEGGFDQSLSHYIQNTQHGLPMRISKVKWSESETVRSNAKMVAQRTISGVPATVDVSGTRLLVAHIALATGRAGSPRLYFEDTVSAAGFVTVGYIGAHLDNTMTN